MLLNNAKGVRWVLFFFSWWVSKIHQPLSLLCLPKWIERELSNDDKPPAKAAVEENCLTRIYWSCCLTSIFPAQTLLFQSFNAAMLRMDLNLDQLHSPFSAYQTMSQKKPFWQQRLDINLTAWLCLQPSEPNAALLLQLNVGHMLFSKKPRDTVSQRPVRQQESSRVCIKLSQHPQCGT